MFATNGAISTNFFIFLATRGAHGVVGGQAVLGRLIPTTTPWLTKRHGKDVCTSIYPLER